MNEKQPYINFDEYIRASEPHKRERAEAWRVAIGLQAVDGLQVSEYLKQTARQHIEGEITIDEARELCCPTHGQPPPSHHRRRALSSICNTA